MNQSYIYSDNAHIGYRAVVVLPEIFGITDFIKRTTDRFAEEFDLPAYALDHFYSVTGRCEVLDYNTGMARGVEVMQQMTGDGFYEFFANALDEIQAEQPSITEFIVVGFCFGGRLAYLAGMDGRVNKVVSFYGGQPHLPNYYDGNSPVEALISAKGGSGLQVLSFYGGQDESILAEDRAKTKQLLGAAGIGYTEKVYGQAGHAYFNDSRPERYSAKAAEGSWVDIKKFI